jgi:hypothetical protein
MRRWISGIAVALLIGGAYGIPWAIQRFSTSDAVFPDPVENQAVYDPAGALTPEIEAALEQRIDATEARTGAELAIYVRIEADATSDSNLADARALIDQWGVGRQGFDDGMVILLTFFDPTFQHGWVSTWAGSGFHAAYMGDGAQQAIREDIIIPAIRQGSPAGGLIAAVDAIDAAITPSATAKLQALRVINGIVGIPGSVLALLLTIGLSYVTWRRYGDDPSLSDSESVLMAGPPADMTPPLATVIRDGRATQHSINTVLVELAGTGYISFRNLDQVGKRKSDDDPDPLLDPAIDVPPRPPLDAKRLAKPEAVAWETIRQSAEGGVLSRSRLWSLNEKLGEVKERLESDAVRLGWLTQLPTPIITRWVVIGAVELVAGIGLVVLGYLIPMSGLTLLGAAFGVGGIVTMALGSAMSQRTPNGAYVDAMLKAYRRTLKKTMDLARSMDQVVAEPTVRTLADTPDKAVIWGIALGLHKEVAAVLERSLADQTPETAASAYYPFWLGSNSASWSAAGSAGGGAGMSGFFSGGGTPDIGGMIGSLGSLGSSPPSSSSSSGGGFGGGGGGGGGGGSSGF